MMMNAMETMVVSVVVIISAMSTVSVNGDQKPSNVTVITKCYDCSSAVNPACGDSYNGSGKFPHEGILNKEHFVVDCAAKIPKHLTDPAPSAAIGCRKILQELDEGTRIVRQCAFTGDTANGLKRTGNQGVRLFYYQCNDKDLCNGAAADKFWLVSLFLPLALAVALAGW